MDAECDKCGKEAVVMRVVRGIPLYLCARCFQNTVKDKPEKQDKFRRYPREGTPIKGEYQRDKSWRDEIEEEICPSTPEASPEETGG